MSPSSRLTVVFAMTPERIRSHLARNLGIEGDPPVRLDPGRFTVFDLDDAGAALRALNVEDVPT